MARFAHDNLASPGDWNYTLHPGDYANGIDALAEDDIIGFVGHTHIGGIFIPDGPFFSRKIVEPEYTLKDGQKAVVNVGSVGQPRQENLLDGTYASEIDTRASYCLYDSETKTIRLIRVEYDVEETAKLLEQQAIEEFVLKKLPKLMAENHPYSLEHLAYGVKKGRERYDLDITNISGFLAWRLRNGR